MVTPADRWRKVEPGDGREPPYAPPSLTAVEPAADAFASPDLASGGHSPSVVGTAPGTGAPSDPAVVIPPTGYGAAPGYGPPVTSERVAPPTGYGAAPAYGPPVTSDRAVITLVLAVGSFLLFPFIPAVIALCLAPGARQEIEASGGRLGGAGLVSAARLIAGINIALCLLVVGALLTLVGLLAGG